MQDTSSSLFIGHSHKNESLAFKYANRHGLIAGATGTGKTITLQVLAEGFSAAGIPVFLADVKGDISALCLPGADADFLKNRAADIGLKNYIGESYPVTYFDVFGKKGHPVRTTITDIGPLLLARILDLNDIQSSVLNVVFHVADTQGLPLLDIADLRAILTYISDNPESIGQDIGHISAATIGVIQRKLIELETENGIGFFGEPALDIYDMMRVDDTGKGHINILAADKLIQSPRLYTAFLLWIMGELFEELPEVGDLDKPKIIFFFDEAHLLFDNTPRALLDQIEQVVRLIRSKGVGIYFVTQSPTDIPTDIAAQLSNRFQHALRAFTPLGQKAVRVAAETLRPNPEFNTASVISELNIGEALVSTLENKGQPSMVSRTLIAPPRSKIGPVDDAVRAEIIALSPLRDKYSRRIDRHSAAEMLHQRISQVAQEKDNQILADQVQQKPLHPTTESLSQRTVGRPRDTLIESGMKSAIRAIGSTIGREIIRSVLGNLTGRRRRY